MKEKKAVNLLEKAEIGEVLQPSNKGSKIVGCITTNDSQYVSFVDLGAMDVSRTEGVNAAFNYLELKANVGQSFSWFFIALAAFLSGGAIVWTLNNLDSIL